MEDLKEIVRPFYTECLTANPSGQWEHVLDTLLAEDFQHINTAQTRNKASSKSMCRLCFVRFPI